MKKVLFISNVLSHIEAFHLPYLAWFKEKGYEVHVMTNAEGKKVDFCDQLFDIRIERSPFNFKNLSALKAAKKIIRAEKYDIIHAHTPMGGVIGRLASIRARKSGTKVLYTAHGFHFYKGAPKINWILYYTMEKFLAKKTDCIITINEEDYILAQEKFASSKTVVEKINGIGVNLKQFSPVTLEEKKQLKKQRGYENKFVMVYAAEFIPRKNHKFFVDAAKKISLIYSDFKILFCGKGELVAQTQAYVCTQGVQQYIEFMGFRKDMPTIYKMSDALISASFQEGLPINIAEGMAAGLPVVASQVRGHVDLVQHSKNGFLFDTGSLQTFVEQILLLVNDKQLCKQFAQASVTFANEYGIERTIAQMQAIYERYLK